MDEEHRGDVVKSLTQMFSNRKVGEFFTSMLVNRGIVEKDRELLAGAKGTEGADIARSEDPYVAMNAVVSQMKDAAAALISVKPATEAMNALAGEIASKSKAVQEGRFFDFLPEDDRRIIGGAITAWNMPLSDVNERSRLDSLRARQREVGEKLRQGGYSDKVTRDLRMKDFELRSGIDASVGYSSQPPIFSDAERERWEEIDREHRRAAALSGMGGSGAMPDIPMPTADPRKQFGEMPPVQSLEGASVKATLTGSAEVSGEVTVKNEVTASSSLIQIVEGVKSLSAKVSGMFNANGPGSLGHSSPDAAPGFNGVP